MLYGMTVKPILFTLFSRPNYAFRSDPRNMSSLMDPQYAPLPRGENKFLAFILNICDMRRPVPLNLTPEEIILFYDTLMQHRQQKQLQNQQSISAEESDFYGGSMNPLPADWYKKFFR